jgi:hypothetical protein
MARPQRLLYLTFDARSIRDTGRCSWDPGSRTTPYPEAEIADPQPSQLTQIMAVVRCPVCGMSRRQYTRLESESSSTLFVPFWQRTGGPAGPAWGAGGGSPPAALTSPRTRDLGAQRQPAPTPTYSMDRATVASIAAGERRAEPMGTEQIDFDNSNSSSSSVETLHITHSTEFAISFDQERATTAGARTSVTLLGFAAISGSLQQTLRSHHSVGVKSTFTVQRISEIRVPARKHVRVTLTWKRIWQDGIVNLRTTQGVDVAVPYSLTVDLGFDKKTDDVS